MARRFADINRGPELQDAYNKLDDWRKLTRAQKKATYAAVAKPATERVKTERVIAYVRPFGTARDDIYYETTVPAAAQTGEGGALATLLRALASGRFVEIAPAGATDTIIDVPKFRFARIRASQKATGTTAVQEGAVSRLTGRPYKRVRTNSMQINFGKSAAQSDYFAAVKAIMALPDYNTFNNTPGNSISFKPEGS